MSKLSVNVDDLLKNCATIGPHIKAPVSRNTSTSPSMLFELNHLDRVARRFHRRDMYSRMILHMKKLDVESTKIEGDGHESKNDRIKTGPPWIRVVSKQDGRERSTRCVMSVDILKGCIKRWRDGGRWSSMERAPKYPPG